MKDDIDYMEGITCTQNGIPTVYIKFWFLVWLKIVGTAGGVVIVLVEELKFDLTKVNVCR